jgi:hypothetical protein
MKNIFSSSILILCAILTMSNHKCSKTSGHGITVSLTTNSQVVNPNVTKAGTAFEQSYTFKTGEEFQKKFGVSSGDITTFSFESFSIAFTDQARCADLESYTVEAQFAQIATISTSNTCTLPNFNGKPAIISFKRFNTQDTRAIKVLDTNFASYIKAGKDIVITVKMVAAKDLPAGFGLKAELQASIEYAVSE